MNEHVYTNHCQKTGLLSLNTVKNNGVTLPKGPVFWMTLSSKVPSLPPQLKTTFPKL